MSDEMMIVNRLAPWLLEVVVVRPEGKWDHAVAWLEKRKDAEKYVLKAAATPSSDCQHKNA